jgi:hypothetical protein
MVECQECGRDFFTLERPDRCRSAAREKKDVMVVVVVAAGGAGAPLGGGSGSSGPLCLSLLLRTVVEVSRRAPYWELREKTSIPPSYVKRTSQIEIGCHCAWCRGFFMHTQLFDVVEGGEIQIDRNKRKPLPEQ